MRQWGIGLAAALAVGACLSSDGDDDGAGATPDAAATFDSGSGVDAPSPPATFTLTVAPTAGGAIVSAPGDIDCAAAGGTCSATFDEGTAVTLTATPDAMVTFAGWFGACAGTGATAQVTVDADVTCGGAFVELTGDIDVIDPPVSVIPNDTEDDANTLMFVEQIDVPLTDPVPLDVHTSGTFANALPAPAATPADVRVNVYFVHFDPTGLPTIVASDATIVFPDPIVGLISSAGNLDATDGVFGISGVTYPTGTHPDRAIETIPNRDTMTVENDRRTLTLALRTGESADQLRVVTLAPGQSLPRIESLTTTTVAAPDSVVAGATEADGFTVFDEGAVTLGTDLAVDATAPARYDAPGTLSPSTIATGTAVRSVLLHFDPPAVTDLTRVGSITFEREVLGFIVTVPNLEASDVVLGAAGTAYPAAGTEVDRGLELGSGDVIIFGGDRRSFRYTMRSAGATDHLRVILAE